MEEMLKIVSRADGYKAYDKASVTTRVVARYYLTEGFENRPSVRLLQENLPNSKEYGTNV